MIIGVIVQLINNLWTGLNTKHKSWLLLLIDFPITNHKSHNNQPWLNVHSVRVSSRFRKPPRGSQTLWKSVPPPFSLASVQNPSPAPSWCWTSSKSSCCYDQAASSTTSLPAVPSLGFTFKARLGLTATHIMDMSPVTAPHPRLGPLPSPWSQGSVTSLNTPSKRVLMIYHLLILVLMNLVHSGLSLHCCLVTYLVFVALCL